MKFVWMNVRFVYNFDCKIHLMVILYYKMNIVRSQAIKVKNIYSKELLDMQKHMTAIIWIKKKKSRHDRKQVLKDIMYNKEYIIGNTTL